MKKLLVPLDGSELSESVLPLARLISEKYRAKVELLQCYEPPASAYLFPELTAPPPTYDEQAFSHDDIKEYLAKQARRFLPDVATPVVGEGDPAMCILDRCESHGVDWVALASHGRGGLGRWLLGSVATKVVRGSKVPVLVVNAETEVKMRPEIKRILVCVDGSETSEVALPQAVSLARHMGASLTLYQGIAYTPIGNPTLDAAINFELKNSRDYLEKLKARFTDVDISVRTRSAGPGLGIVEEGEKADLIVIGSHGRSGMKRWLLGSIAENVIQSATRPVLVVYQRSEEE